MSDESMVFVVDDDAAARSSVESLLASVGIRVEAFPSVARFLERPLTDAPCCLVLDVRMPLVSGIDLQRDLNARGVFIPVIFITGHGDIPMSVEAMKAGALEFLTKPFRGQVLLDAIHKGLEVDRIRKEDRRRLNELRGRMESLTPREREVMAGVVEGKLNKEIAGELGTSERTVKLQRANVMRKMGAETLADLIRLSEQAQSANQNPLAPKS